MSDDWKCEDCSQPAVMQDILGDGEPVPVCMNPGCPRFDKPIRNWVQ